jgi:hypothetical protein
MDLGRLRKHAAFGARTHDSKRDIGFQNGPAVLHDHIPVGRQGERPEFLTCRRRVSVRVFDPPGEDPDIARRWFQVFANRGRPERILFWCARYGSRQPSEGKKSD